MAIEVNIRLRQSLSRAILGSSLAGDGLLVRLRSASIALLAVVAAIGLGLIAFVMQMGWPTVFSGPIPAGPELGVVRNDPIVAPPASIPQGSRAPYVAERTVAATGGRATSPVAPTVNRGPDLAPAHQTQPAPVESTPAPPTSPEPAAQPVVSPQPAAIVVKSPSDAGSPPPQTSVSGTPESKDDKDKDKGKSGSRRSRTPRTVPPPSTDDKDKEGKNDLEEEQGWGEDHGSDAEDHDWSGGSNGRWSRHDDHRRGGWGRD